jgi:DnaJ-class molecular chaperone
MNLVTLPPHSDTLGAHENQDKQVNLAVPSLTAESHAEADYDDESLCPECEGDGGDKWNDYCLPCPTCGGDGRLW